MRSDVASIQLSQKRKLSYAEYALIAMILAIATKFCTLPSVLAGSASSKAIWTVLLLLGTEFLLLFFATKTAKSGGLLLLPLKKGVRIPVLALFTIFFLLKLTAFSREIATYYALSLFENVQVLPILILLLVACAAVARKGYVTIGRMSEIFVWLFLFVFLFVVIFTRADGDGFHALAMFNPDFSGMGEGFYKGLAWSGDSAVVALLDLRGEERFSPHARGVPTPEERTRAKRKIVAAALLFATVLVTLFYALFLSAYGDAAKMTDYAFIKLSVFKANTDELGSADWPIIILWSILSCLYLSLIFLSGKECLSGIRDEKDARKNALSIFFLLGGAAVLLSMLFLDEEGDYESFMAKAMSVASILAGALTIGTGVYAMINRKEAKNEEQE